MPLAELVRTGRLEVEGYGGLVLGGQVEQVERQGDGRLAVTLAYGRTLTGRRLLVATGLVDELPDVPGVQERWGRDVLHCPYCQGWEVRDQTIVVLASGPQSVHQALLFRQLTNDVTLLDHTLPPTEQQHEQLRARGIRVVNGTAAGLQVQNDRLTGVRLADGHVVPCTALVVATQMRSRTGFLASLGLAPVEHPFGVRDHLAADLQGRTEAPGAWVAGNVTDLAAQVGAATAAGAAAGAAINGDLVMEDARTAVDMYRADSTVNASPTPRLPDCRCPVNQHDQPGFEEFDAAYWEDRYRSGVGVDKHDPSRSLLTGIAGLRPGTALDAGCGVGGDALWLAARGWHVTAVDVSASAIDQGRQVASSAGPAFAERIDWVQGDLTEWEPRKTFDLVTSQYVHSPGPPEALFRRLAAWVAPGGTLLVVGHDAGHGHRPGHAHPAVAQVRAEQVVSGLPAEQWDIVAAEARIHTMQRPGGGSITLDDVVVHARRRAHPSL